MRHKPLGFFLIPRLLHEYNYTVSMEKADNLSNLDFDLIYFRMFDTQGDFIYFCI